MDENKREFWTLTGEDFGRSIAWARQQPNVVSEQIRSIASSLSKKAK
jgi:hypothetical protein